MLHGYYNCIIVDRIRHVLLHSSFDEICSL